MNSDLIFSPSDFVAVVNQTLEFALPTVVVEGELANFRISKNRWVYFDLKDELASVKFFGTVYNLPGPLEEGMKLRVSGRPQLHPNYGFSVTIRAIELSGEGTIKKAFELMQAKLAAEGLFDVERKRPLPYPPRRIGLITSAGSAAYADFVKIISARFSGLDIRLADVLVQGESAPAQLVRAVEWFNGQSELVDALVIIRGGGSPDDLQAFSTESVTRAVAASRIPTLVAIGHEVDLSLAELAADTRASTPSNAAELLVPDKKAILNELKWTKESLEKLVRSAVTDLKNNNRQTAKDIDNLTGQVLTRAGNDLANLKKIVKLLDPLVPLNRGYALLQKDKTLIKSVKQVASGDQLKARLADGHVKLRVE